MDLLGGVELAVRLAFASVPQMTTAELAQLIARSSTPVVLLDVRTAAEYEVSHLAGAHRFDPPADRSLLESLAPVLKSAGLHEGQAATLVLYCSVGYRSSDLAARLASEASTTRSSTGSSTPVSPRTSPQAASKASDQPPANSVADPPTSWSGLRYVNLQGSIFRWALENRPLVNSAGVTVRVVHGYNRTWARLLPSDRVVLNP